MSKAKYIVFEGTEGVGKSTHSHQLAEFLRSKGFKVLETKEPGTPHAPLTMELRKIMLDNKYASQLTVAGRELVNQAIRSIHIEKVIMPALSEYDYIIQDRGMLSGFAYGHACGNSHWFLTQLTNQVISPTGLPSFDLYDMVVYLKSDSAASLLKAQMTKQEFEAGDVMETRGHEFIQKVSSNMDEMVKGFRHCIINTDGHSIDENFQEVLRHLSGELI